MDGHRAIVTGRLSPTDKRSFPSNTALSKAFRRIAVLAAAGIIGAASPAEAAPSGFWPDYYEPYPPPRFAPPRVRKSIKMRLPAHEDVAKDARKPQGPLIIAISIEKQVLKVYDANGFFAETPISTGMRGHSTPMGVFSVIQKHKYHHSNIYSGAPMPYMQRITWSGVAMHAGVLPGYPASHGCIRMPMNFAVKMWGWTRMGARVVITPGELAPESFSHPLLATQKTPSVAAVEPQKNADVAVTAKSDKAALVAPAVAPAYSEASLELKSTVGHDLARPAAGTHTADASSALSQPRSPVTIIDAPVASNPAMKVADDAGGPSDKAGDAPASEPVKAESVVPEEAKTETAEVTDMKAGAPTTVAATTDEPRAVDKAEEAVKAAADADAGATGCEEGPGPPIGSGKGGLKAGAGARRWPEAQRADRRVRQQEGRQALCAAEFYAAVRRAGDDRSERPPARNPCLHGANRQGRRQSAALVGGVDARGGAQRRHGRTTTNASRGGERQQALSKSNLRPCPTAPARRWIA